MKRLSLMVLLSTSWAMAFTDNVKIEFDDSKQDSIQMECEDFQIRLESAFKIHSVIYNDFEKQIINIIYGEKSFDKNYNELLIEIISHPNEEYKIDNENLKQMTYQLYHSYGNKEFKALFSHQDYETEFSASFWIWSYTWSYLSEHNIDLITFCKTIQTLTNYYDVFDLNLRCNQKAFVFFLGKVILNQDKVERRLDFYEKTETIALDFFKSANIDFDEFENDFYAYLGSYDFNDSTTENQLFSFSFLTSSLGFIPLPKTEDLRNKFRKYHRQLFSQTNFIIDESRIVPRPKSYDSLQLYKHIMRAYPDSMMYSPGKTKLGIDLEKIIESEDVEDSWFLGFYAGVLKYDDRKYLSETAQKYMPVDLQSNGLKAWYYLFVMQEMFNGYQSKFGSEVRINYYVNQTKNILTYYMIEMSLEDEITQSEYNRSGTNNFSESIFYFEIFNHALFKNKVDPFTIQLKIDTMGQVIPSKTLSEPQLSKEQLKFIHNALSKYTFNQFQLSSENQHAEGWIQIRSKQKTAKEIEEEKNKKDYWGDNYEIDMSSIEEVIDDLSAEEVIDEDQEKVYDFVEEEPFFPNGDEALQAFIKNELKKKEYSGNGTVYIKFIVNKDGSFSNIGIRKGINDTLDQLAKEIVTAMPNWIPGKVDGKIVRVNYTLPIKF